LIRSLVAFDLDVGSYAAPAGREDYFKMILRDGFVGYHNMTDDDLRREAYDRGLT
jgi:hypothetical protein